jgi:hypothetical protein
MRRYVVLLAVVTLLVASLAVPAFAQGQGPEGGNPGHLLCHQGRTVGAEGLQPLPFGGQPESGLLPGESEEGWAHAPRGVVFTSPGSPHSSVNPPDQQCPA